MVFYGHIQEEIQGKKVKATGFGLLHCFQIQIEVWETLDPGRKIGHSQKLTSQGMEFRKNVGCKMNLLEIQIWTQGKV
jgi:hypothetical protein